VTTSYGVMGAMLAWLMYASGAETLAFMAMGALIGALFAKLDDLRKKLADVDLRARQRDTIEAWRPAAPAAAPPSFNADTPTPAAPVPPLVPPPLVSVVRAQGARAEPMSIAEPAAALSTQPEMETAPDIAPAAPAPRPLFAASEPQPPALPIRPSITAPEAAPGWGGASQSSYVRADSSGAAELPDWANRLLSFENWPIKLGMLLLLVGLASGFRYLAAHGYLTVPIEVRLILIALGAIAALVFGYSKRVEKPSFSLSVQGGALGALLMTVYAALQLYQLISGGVAFSLMLGIVATGVALAVAQDALWLALFASIGGFAAPMLASTGGGSHLQLFGYYLILNLGILSIALQKGWRSLNILGAVCTFGIGLTWGVNYYQPALFNSVEPFLLAFFGIYVAITVLYTVQHGAGEPVLDGVLVFGVPLASLGAQSGLLAGQSKKLAISSFCAALLYAGLNVALRSKPQAELLRKCFTVLAVAFFTLAIPLYFSAQMTSALWALEGAGVLWLGLRQQRSVPTLLGIALQIFAAISYVGGYTAMTTTPTLVNARFLGAAVLALAAFLCGWLLERSGDASRAGAPRVGSKASSADAHATPNFAPLAIVGVVAGYFWWSFASLSEITRYFDNAGPGADRFQIAAIIVWLAATMLLSAIARRALAFAPLALGIFVPLALLPALTLGLHGALFEHGRLAAFFVYGLASLASMWLWALPRNADADDAAEAPLGLRFAHGLWLIGVCLLASFAFDQPQLGEGLRYFLCVAPFGAVYFCLGRGFDGVIFPLHTQFAAARAQNAPNAWPTLLSQLWTLAMLAALVFGMGLVGAATPLRYVPLFNPLELTLVALFAMLFAYARHGRDELDANVRLGLLALAFCLITSATLRTVIHLYDPTLASLAHAFFNRTGQAALALVWSVAGCGAMLLGHLRQRRATWISGAALMAVVLVKMLLVDRHNLGELPGIFATLGVGALLAAVGYFAPMPPQQSDSPPQ
jgi:uncharacterized membrane protein